jgi:hypothetical protein
MPFTRAFSDILVRALSFSHTARYGREVGSNYTVSGHAFADLMSLFLSLSDVINFIIFQGFLVCVHYMLETVGRPSHPTRDAISKKHHF